MNRGYVKLWRKALDNGWLQNHALWAFWSYCLLRANHKETIVIIGYQEVPLKPGQFIFGRKRAARDLNMTEWKIRSCLYFLKKAGNITIKTTNKFSIITIVNWNTYQGHDIQEPPAKPPSTRHQPATDKNDKNDKKNDSAKIAGDISLLKERFSDQNLIDKTFQAIASTRRSNRVADSVLLAQLQKWKKYPVEQVEAGIRIFLDKDYAAQGKREEYLLAIIRNQKVGEPKQQSTGSPLLDSYYATNGN